MFSTTAESSPNATPAGGQNDSPISCPPAGPLVLNQTFTVGTGYGFITRCGCGWRSIHDAKIAAVVSGQRHLRDAHERTPE